MLCLRTFSLLSAEEPERRTPRAGERYADALFGKPYVVEERDRSRATDLGAGAVFLASAPDRLGVGPWAGLEIWRVTPGESRLRAILAGLANELRWDRALRRGAALSSVVVADTLTLPWARSEYADGVRLRDQELEWHTARAGLGIAWRRALAPGAVDNGVDAALTLEAGGLFFARGDRTAASFVLPRDTLEMRLHLRLRADSLERNLLEMPHRGWAAGADVVGARRARWAPWGDPAVGLEAGGRTWRAVSAFAVAALGPPGVSERHRVVAMLHAGIGGGLDRFSSFRLGSGSTWGDFETLSHAYLPGAGVDELASTRYAIADLEYRYEALFFLFLQARGTLAWADRTTRRDGALALRGGAFPAVSVGFTTALPWSLALESALFRNFGLERTGVLVSVNRSF